MEIIILSVVVVIAFLFFIVTSIIEFSKMDKDVYKYDNSKVKFGRDALYNLLESLFNDKDLSVNDKKKLVKTIERTISDMESDGTYFPLKEELDEMDVN
jgi:hypothetical protein